MIYVQLYIVHISMNAHNEFTYGIGVVIFVVVSYLKAKKTLLINSASACEMKICAEA